MKKTSLLCGVLVVLLAACGQKGPLYLPQSAKPSPDAKTAPGATTQSQQDSKQESKKDTKPESKQDAKPASTGY